MALALQDLENSTLWNLQQSELVNFGGAPLWSQATNPAISQSAIDFMINRAYARVMSDLADTQLVLTTITFPSIAQTSDYPLSAISAAGVWNSSKWNNALWGPALPSPAVQRVTRVKYNPIGQPWTEDFEGGVRLVSWQQFNRYCGFGYLRPFTYNIIPDFCAVTPDRNKLAFFPGTASSGDTITVEFVPELTPGTSFPPLVNATDVLQLPDPASDLVILWATSLCWPKLREMGAAQEYQKMYGGELLRVRDQLSQRSLGDTQRFRDAEEGLALSYPIGGVLSLP